MNATHTHCYIVTRMMILYILVLSSCAVASLACSTKVSPTDAPVTNRPPRPTADPDGDGDGSASELCCDFNSGSCNYESAGNGKDDWRVVDEGDLVVNRYGNRDTGVPYKDTRRGSDDDTDFMGASLPNQPTIAPLFARLSRPTLKKHTMKFYYYEATEHCSVAVCFDTEEGDCEIVSDIGVTNSDREWKAASVSVPKGVEEVTFVCANEKDYHCACGIDNVEIEGVAGC